jgi:hypothetical protein
MKFLFTFLLITSGTFAQERHAIPKEKWSKAFYISDEFCAAKGLKPGEANDLLRVWNNYSSNGTMTRVVDIRLYFTSVSEANDYLDKNIADLSEKGDTINAKIEIPMVSDLRIFRENADIRRMNVFLGQKNNMYFFIFTVKNYLAKVFISGDIKLEEAASFATEAAKRLNAAVN